MQVLPEPLMLPEVHLDILDLRMGQIRDMVVLYHGKLNFRKLSVEERKWLKKIAEKSDLLKNPKPQRGRR